MMIFEDVVYAAVGLHCVDSYYHFYDGGFIAGLLHRIAHKHVPASIITVIKHEWIYEGE